MENEILALFDQLPELAQLVVVMLGFFMSMVLTAFFLAAIVALLLSAYGTPSHHRDEFDEYDYSEYDYNDH